MSRGPRIRPGPRAEIAASPLTLAKTAAAFNVSISAVTKIRKEFGAARRSPAPAAWRALAPEKLGVVLDPGVGTEEAAAAAGVPVYAARRFRVAAGIRKRRPPAAPGLDPAAALGPPGPRSRLKAEERNALARAIAEGGASVAELCRRHGLSRQRGHQIKRELERLASEK